MTRRECFRATGRYAAYDAGRDQHRQDRASRIPEGALTPSPVRPRSIGNSWRALSIAVDVGIATIAHRAVRSRAPHRESSRNAFRTVILAIDIRSPALTDGPSPRGHCLMRAHRVSVTALVALDKLVPVSGHWERRYQHADEGGVRLSHPLMRDVGPCRVLMQISGTATPGAKSWTMERSGPGRWAIRASTTGSSRRSTHCRRSKRDRTFPVPRRYGAVEHRQPASGPDRIPPPHD